MRNLLAAIRDPNLFTLDHRLLDIDSFADGWFGEMATSINPSSKFKVDVYEKDGNWTIKAALPGIQRDEIDLGIEDHVLEITVAKKNAKREENANYVLRELSYGKLSRTFRLPRGIDKEKPNAELKDGVLKVTFPKSPQHSVEIK